MSGLKAVCIAVQKSPVAMAMGASNWLFPAVETIHLCAMVVLVGSIMAFDLRLLGVVLRRARVSEVAVKLLPATWTAFVVMAITGSLLFSSDAVEKYCPNPAFQIKLVLILLAGLNMAIFHFTFYRYASKWDDAPSPPIWAKLTGTISAVLWASVVFAGRWIGFV